MKKEFIIEVKVHDVWIGDKNTWMDKDGKIGLVGTLYILFEHSGKLHLLEKELKQ